MAQLTAQTARAWLAEAGADVEEQADFLTKLDTAIGDGDHGVNMRRGFRAVAEALDGAEDAEGPDRLFILTGRTLVSKVGGASGPLWGQFFKEIGRALRDKQQITDADIADAFAAGVRGIQDLGSAEVGDKTMIDALVPAARALSEAVQDGHDIASALGAATQAARDGAQSTIELVARKGRASYLGERSAGHQDPGSASAVLIVAALERALS